MNLSLPVGRRGPIGEHVLNGCGGTTWEIRKGDRWVLWCDRCGYIPRRWRVRRRVEEQPCESDRVYCRDCLCYAAEIRYCPAVNTSRAPEDGPFIGDCFIPLPVDMRAD
jgi:hypothetical protein